MKLLSSWLRDWLDTDADAATIAETLTAIGLEVESIHNPAEALASFKVAKVLTAEKHPQADKLQVLTVDAGDGPVQVVCGAPNARAGMLGVFGAPGTYVPGSDITLKVAAIRGVESRGMMCSTRELQLGDDHDGIIELPADAPVGASYAEYAKLDDPVFDVNVTPNRPDCMGVNGIARDLAAAGVGQRKSKSSAPIAGFDQPSRTVVVEEDSGCLLFWRRTIRGVRNGPSPDWLQQRLKAVGLRPISALVDITNFFSIDQARPLHVYDVAKLTGDIRVRRGRDGDKFLALNGKEYEPTAEDCVISDESGAIGFGGVIGGESTGVDETTTEVLLECALFDPASVAATGRRHGIASDARARFERGVDPAQASIAIEAAAQMIVELCGGEPTMAIHAGSPPRGEKIIDHFNPEAATQRLAGLEVPQERQIEILEALGFMSRTNGSAQDWQVHVPSWRPDIDGQADLVEEIARIHGYDKVPSTPLPRAAGVALPTATPSQLVERRARRTAAARGFDEAVTWSFIGDKQAATFGGSDWRVSNPISDEMKVMRPSLLPGLLAAAQRNLNRGASTIRLFEIGRRYLADREHPTAALLMTGDRSPRHWQTGKAQDFDAFDAKAEALALLEAVGAPVANLQVVPDAGPVWHPGRSGTLRLGGKTILAAFGELHPRLVAEHDVPGGCVAAEIYLDAIPPGRASGRTRAAFTPPALQSVTRDFAFFVPEELAADALVRAIRGADKAAITSARLFDRFAGKEGLSLAVEVTLQPGEKSFTEPEIAEISKKIVAAAEKLGARLRS